MNDKELFCSINSIGGKAIQKGESIFAVMTPLANKYNAINLSQGFPDLNPDQDLIDRVTYYLNRNVNQYAPLGGVPELRSALSDKYLKLYNRKYDPADEITVTIGATQALFTGIAAFVRPGDEVIVFEPAFDTYVPNILLFGGIPVYCRLKEPEFMPDMDEVAKLITPKTRMIIINTPHNPGGSIFTLNEWKALEKITRGTDIILMCDEVYEHLVFPGKRHISICELDELASRSLVISSFGKLFHTTGWKTGFCLAPKPLMKEFRKIHQNVVFTVNHPVQRAYADFMKEDNQWKILGKFYQSKRDLFLNETKDSRFVPLQNDATFFQLLDYSKMFDEHDFDLAVRLTKNFGIASIPLSVFYHDNYNPKLLRFCFAKDDETLIKAAEILCKI